MFHGTSSATVERTEERRIACIYCGCAFRYRMTREATAYADDPTSRGAEAADDRAERKLDRMFARENDPVACPSCGAFQPDMTATVRRYHLKWMKRLAFYLIPGLPALGLVAVLALELGIENEPLRRSLRPWTYGMLWSGPFWALLLLGLRFVLAMRIDLNRAGANLERWTKNAPPAEALPAATLKEHVRV